MLTVCSSTFQRENKKELTAQCVLLWQALYLLDHYPLRRCHLWNEVTLTETLFPPLFSLYSGGFTI
jgi:hypothetical protein